MLRDWLWKQISEKYALYPIAAVDDDYEVSKEGKIPWRVEEDFMFFWEWVYDQLPGRNLRRNWVVHNTVGHAGLAVFRAAGLNSVADAFHDWTLPKEAQEEVPEEGLTSTRQTMSCTG